MTRVAGKRAGVALVVGISQYPHQGIPALRFAARDARAVARVLADPDVCNFPPDQVALLLGAEACRDAIVRHLSKWLPETGRGAEIAVIYFAGHGMVRREGMREEGYLLPADADPDDLVTHGVAMSQLAQWVDAIQARAVILCLDCCHAAKVLRRQVGEGGSIVRDLGLGPAVLSGLSGEGRFLIASCGEDQFSHETPALRHGLFTYHLLRGIRGAADENRDDQVGVVELFEYVAREVSRAAEQLGVRQTPWTTAVNAGGVYLSAPRKKVAPASATDLDRLWEKDRTAALRKLQEQLPQAGEDVLLPPLRLLRKKPDLAALPLLFHCLSLPLEKVRQKARLAVDALGWPKTAARIEELARAGDPETVAALLEGLAAFEASPTVVGLLDRLAFLLKDNLRERAIHLLGRKRLGLQQEKTAELLKQFHSPYQILRPLGQGLFTAAYLARHILTEGEVVVRVLRPEFAEQPALRGLFLDLAKRSFQTVHHNLVRGLDVQAFPEHAFYFAIRDHVPGVTLQKLATSGKRFEPLQVVKIVRQIAEALTPWHRAGFPHGGVKPSNIFVCEESRVILGDPSPPLPNVPVADDRLAYDYRYAAPEMFRSGPTVGPAADLYALGCVACELFCGAPPFVSDSHFELVTLHSREAPVAPSRRGGSDRAGDALVLRLLSKQPCDRFRTLEELLEALDRLREGLQSRDRADNPPPEIPSDEAKHPNTIGLLEPDSLDRYASLCSLPAPADGDVSYSVPEGGPPERLEATPVSHAPRHGIEALPQIPGYVIESLVGRGGMGVVYKARQMALRRAVALKIILAGGYAGDAAVRRFLTEAEVIARIQHPNIVQIHEVGEYDGRPFMALEFVEGGTLAQRLAGTPLLPHEAARLVETLARAMQTAHGHQIIHRDLKPANVLLSADGAPKITDFGLAKRLDDVDAHTGTGEVLGTPSYMAPEQAAGHGREVGPLADVYALGTILYECLTGRPPFQSSSVMETMRQVLEREPVPPRWLCPSVPRDLETVCLKCLEKAPHNRYASADALADDLARFLAGEPIRARPASGLERFWKYARRRPMTVAFALTLVLFLGTALTLLLWYLQSR